MRLAFYALSLAACFVVGGVITAFVAAFAWDQYQTK